MNLTLTNLPRLVIFGAGSLEHIVSGDFNLQRPLFFNIHRERLYTAEPPCMTRIRTVCYPPFLIIHR